MIYQVERFLKYSLTGGSTFLVDLCLLYVLTDVFGWNYLVSAAVGFTIAVSLNYWLARKFVFSETLRGVREGYIIFGSIALGGVLIVIGLMYILVAKFGWPYLLSRIAVASFAGIWNYFLNFYVNFKVDTRD
ncbi:MAG: GtrA family protein [Candidatus Moranbacteria bacterium]|nr:GtrA family protein [Candidatus Moranbacteria bacterium]